MSPIIQIIIPKTYGQRYNRIKQADISVREMGFQRENLEQNLKMQVELQMDNINKNVKQISTSAAGVEEADKAFSIMQKSFQIGAATYIDLRDAEYAQTQAKLSNRVFALRREPLPATALVCI